MPVELFDMFSFPQKAGFFVENFSGGIRGRLNHFMEMPSRFFSESRKEEMVCTVFALQEGISRLRDRDVEWYEGRGTVISLKIYLDNGSVQKGTGDI